MTTLIAIHDGAPTTTSKTIADGTNNSHKAVIQLARKYQPDLEEFGQLTFEMGVESRHGAGQKTEIAILNERQATLLLSYMRNTPTIREFKKRLVKAFYEMAEELKGQQGQIPPPSHPLPSQSLPPPIHREAINAIARKAAEPWVERYRQFLRAEIETLQRGGADESELAMVLSVMEITFPSLARKDFETLDALRFVQDTGAMERAVEALKALNPVINALHVAREVESPARPTRRPAPSRGATGR